MCIRDRCDGLTRKLVIAQDHGEHPLLPVKAGVGVDVHEGVLLQEVLAQHTRNLERQLIAGAERVLADELDDLLQVALLLEHVHGLVAVLHELHAQMLVEPRAQGAEVQRIGVQPVDGLSLIHI